MVPLSAFLWPFLASEATTGIQVAGCPFQAKERATEGPEDTVGARVISQAAFRAFVGFRAMLARLLVMEEQMATKAETAVRDYLASLKGPGALVDDDRVAALRQQLQQTDDQMQRVQIQQQLLDAQSPATDSLVEDFVTHARSWADKRGISAQAFLAEGVPARVLRRAGFRVPRAAAPGQGQRRPRRQARGRVTRQQVAAAIPDRLFTVAELQKLSGASPAVVRTVVRQQLQTGALTDAGADPAATGRGRAPARYRRAG